MMVVRRFLIRLDQRVNVCNDQGGLMVRSKSFMWVRMPSRRLNVYTNARVDRGSLMCVG